MSEFKIDQDYVIEVTEEAFTLKHQEKSYPYKTLKLVLQQYLSLALDEDNFDLVFKNAQIVETKIKRQYKKCITAKK